MCAVSISSDYMVEGQKYTSLFRRTNAIAK